MRMNLQDGCGCKYLAFRDEKRMEKRGREKEE